MLSKCLSSFLLYMPMLGLNKMRFKYSSYVILVLGFYFFWNTNGRPSNSKGQKFGKTRYETSSKELKLTKEEWKQLHKFEDALKDEEGKLFYTDSWAVQLADLAEVEVADRIAAKHGFVNLGQVGTELGRLLH